MESKKWNIAWYFIGFLGWAHLGAVASLEIQLSWLFESVACFLVVIYLIGAVKDAFEEQ